MGEKSGSRGEIFVVDEWSRQTVNRFYPIVLIGVSTKQHRLARGQKQRDATNRTQLNKPYKKERAGARLC